MILIVGGIGSGKTQYVKANLGYPEEKISQDVWSEKPVLLGLEESIRSVGVFSEDWFAPLCQKEVVVCCEVGCGVVPISGAERRWRDEVGRACNRLAAEAETVVRMVCGIPQVIKGIGP